MQKNQPKKQGVALTKREMQCLILAMQHKPLLEISKQLKIGPGSVYAYLNRIQKKLH